MRNLEAGIKNLEGFGRLYFTADQLFYETCRLSGFSFSRAIRKSIPFAGTAVSFPKMPKTIETPLDRRSFDKSLERYLKDHKIMGLLELATARFSDTIPTDLMLYGLPKVLICESDAIAQMLRANQFHLQTPCAVFSLSEAVPLSEKVKTMMKRAENPKIYFLHDASIEAFSKLQKLRQMIELKEDVPLRPLGIRPLHAQRMRLFSKKGTTQGFDFSGFDYLLDAEKEWLLEGNQAEVSGVSPVRLLRVLRRIILGFAPTHGEWQIKLPKKDLGFM